MMNNYFRVREKWKTNFTKVAQKNTDPPDPRYLNNFTFTQDLWPRLHKQYWGLGYLTHTYLNALKIGSYVTCYKF